MSQSSLNIVVALHCEAKPIIERYQLKKITHLNLPFPIFVNKNLNLIVSGVGKINVAVATTFLFSWAGASTNTSFLNIGIAGSSQFELGAGILAHKIIEASTLRSFYPFTGPIKKIPQGILLTCDRPQTTYPQEGLVDMEGYGFFNAANCFVTKELIQVFKVVSDTSEVTLKRLDERQVTQLIANQLPEIDSIKNYLLQLSATMSISEHPSLNAFLQKWHFTHAQTIQLKELLRRWGVQIQTLNPVDFCHQETTAAAILNKMTNTLDAHGNYLR